MLAIMPSAILSEFLGRMEGVLENPKQLFVDKSTNNCLASFTKPLISFLFLSRYLPVLFVLDDLLY